MARSARAPRCTPPPRWRAGSPCRSPSSTSGARRPPTARACSTRHAATCTRTGSPSAARRSPATPISASWSSSASVATTCCSSAPTDTRASSRWCSAARPSSCCGTAPARCSWRVERWRWARPGRGAAVSASAAPARQHTSFRAGVPAQRRCDGGPAPGPSRVAVASAPRQGLLGAAAALVRVGRGRAVAAGAEAGDARLEGADAPLDQPLLLEDDLRKGDGGQVLAGVVLEDLHVLASLHPAPDLVERHVAALARVVELAVAVAFDESAHRPLPAITAPRAGTTFDGNLR